MAVEMVPACIKHQTGEEQFDFRSGRGRAINT